jgi:hypothetical protein
MFLNTSGKIMNNFNSTNSHPGFVGWPFISTRSRHLDVISIITTQHVYSLYPVDHACGYGLQLSELLNSSFNWVQKFKTFMQTYFMDNHLY